MCSYVGDARDFTRGCPNCGYAGADAGKNTEGEGFETFDYDKKSNAPPRVRTPDWVWFLAIAMILAVFGGLVVIYLNL